MFTIHQTDRSGDPHKELARSQYIDVATALALALARHYHPEDSEFTQNAMDEGRAAYVICDDGKPYEYIVLRQSNKKRWITEPAKKEKR